MTPSTPRDFIAFAEQRFRKADLHYAHGTDNAGDEAAYLVLGALGLPFDESTSAQDRPLPQAQCELLRSLIDRRITERMPVAYLIHRAWFAGIPFYVDGRVLIPRSPIAELIEERFAPWVEESRVKRILDLGTGSGCIAITCAMAFPEARVDAIEISPDALAVASENVASHGLERRVQCLQSDVFEALSGRSYDLIVANLPYVAADKMATLPAEHRHEPVVAMAGGKDGLNVVRRLLRDAPRHLNDGGVLVAEVGASAGSLIAQYPKVPFTWLDFERGGDGVFLLHKQELPAGA